MSHPKTPNSARNPVIEAFGETPLIELSSQALRAGLEKLRAMRAEVVEQIAALRKGNVQDILTGKHIAVDAMLQPGSEMEQAQRWRQALDAALEAAEQALKLARQREKDATIAERRKTIEAMIERHGKAAAHVDQCVVRLAAAMTELDGAGLAILRKVGTRLSGSIAQPFLHENIRHLIELGLHQRTEGLWAYERVPLARRYFPLVQESSAMCADVLAQFEERIEQQLARQETAGGAAEQAA